MALWGVAFHWYMYDENVKHANGRGSSLGPTVIWPLVKHCGEVWRRGSLYDHDDHDDYEQKLPTWGLIIYQFVEFGYAAHSHSFWTRIIQPVNKPETRSTGPVTVKVTGSGIMGVGIRGTCQIMLWGGPSSQISGQRLSQRRCCLLNIAHIDRVCSNLLFQGGAIHFVSHLNI